MFGQRNNNMWYRDGIWPMWAEKGERVDPDLDTEHPSFKENKYEEGWGIEKPPENWQNFIHFRNENRIVQWLKYGIFEYHDEIEYKLGALSFKDGRLQTLTNEGWVFTVNTTYEKLNNLLHQLKRDYSNHLESKNPHRDNLENIGVYHRDEIYRKFDDRDNPSNITHHVRQLGNVHNLTPEQANTLDKNKGGVFTGDILLREKTILSDGHWVEQVIETDSTNLKTNREGLSIRPDGNGFYNIENTFYRILTEKNLNEFILRIKNKFTLPMPVFSMYMVPNDLNDLWSIGNWELTGEVDTNGLLVEGSKLELFNNFELDATVYLNDVYNSQYIQDMRVKSSDMEDFGNWVRNIHGYERINECKIFPRLTNLQKASLLIKT